ncbi:hypothetical protein A6F57_05945 [Alteromonas stellipolaris]|nr:hypothetical protein A6F57_05945 [Alteromonas stellipolaris]
MIEAKLDVANSSFVEISAKSASKNTLAKKTPALGPAFLESSLLLLITYKAIKAKVITFSRVKNAYVRFQ